MESIVIALTSIHSQYYRTGTTTIKWNYTSQLLSPSYSNVILYFSPVTCGSLGLIGGRVTYNRDSVNGRYPVDTRASFSCNPGYSRSGSSSRTCQTSGNWNQQMPRCNQSKVIFVLNVRLYQANPYLSMCSFNILNCESERAIVWDKLYEWYVGLHPGGTSSNIKSYW